MQNIDKRVKGDKTELQMLAKTLMIQGTASSVGKSMIVTALCRILKQDGYNVVPFKAQNMSNNSYVAIEGGEIGRAQAVQAEAARLEPSVWMNPILLKPEADHRSQIIILGKATYSLEAQEYYKYTDQLFDIVKKSLEKLRKEYDIVIIEGAGSPAEINLKEREIVNMRVAEIYKSPVILVGDIDRGGVFASIYGTIKLLSPQHRRLIKGIIVNKFRGQIALLEPGIKKLEEITKKQVLGVIPYIYNLGIAQEDGVYLEEQQAKNKNNCTLNIGIIYLPRISNYDDFDPLIKLNCNIKWIKSADQLNDIDLIIIPGTKSTVADLHHIRRNGIAQKIIEKANSGTYILGICGGFQMLGKYILDPLHIESNLEKTHGLGLLNTTTTFAKVKNTTRIKGTVVCNKGLFEGLKGRSVTGYKIHMGSTLIKNNENIFKINNFNSTETYSEGAINAKGNVAGTYIHGLFNSDDFTIPFIENLINKRGYDRKLNYFTSTKEQDFNHLADIVRSNINMETLYKIAKLK